MVCAFRSSCSRESDVLHSTKVSPCFCCRSVAVLFDFWNACSVAASATADSSVCASGLDCVTCLSSSVYAAFKAVCARSQRSNAAFCAFASCAERLRCHSAAPPATSASATTAETEPMMIFLRLPSPPFGAACSGGSPSPLSPPSIGTNDAGASGSGTAVWVSFTSLTTVRVGPFCAMSCVRSTPVLSIAGIAVVLVCAASAGVNSWVGSSSSCAVAPAPHTGRSNPSPDAGCAAGWDCAAGLLDAADFGFRRCVAGGWGGCAGCVCCGSSSPPTDGNISVELSNDVSSVCGSSCPSPLPASGNCRSDSSIWLIFPLPLRR